jgi:hypothetical protein
MQYRLIRRLPHFGAESLKMTDVLDMLHDAVVKSITFLWQERQVHLLADVFDIGFTSEAKPHLIIFHEVDQLVVPCRNPWGPSPCINTAVRQPGLYSIEMQSGDVIEIVALSITATPQ